MSTAKLAVNYPHNDELSDKTAKMTLLKSTQEMQESLTLLQNINAKANFIALNAAIEAARSQSQTENFSLVADQVSRQAQRTEELAEKLREEIRNLQLCALKATAVRFADIAADIIDKVDRNLFERNCDCQAWATFEPVVHCAKDTFNITGDELRQKVNHDDHGQPQSFDSEMMIDSCIKALEGLSHIYCVYEDIFVLNNKGIIVACAERRHLIGQNQSDAEYFQRCMKSDAVHVSDMHFSSLTKSYAVSYSAPILAENGEKIGVLSTRFNWKFAQDIIDKMQLESSCRAYLINKEGSLIASSGKRGILRDNLSWLMAGEQAVSGGSGYTIECARNGKLTAWGYSRTRGFANYPGKGWSAIVADPIDLKNAEFICQPIARDGESHLVASELANKELEMVAEKISKLVKSINLINNETNMLAVNASIQAGVAGAEGESFAVIATEIGRLAKQSEDFVSIVNSLTEALSSRVQNTVAVRLGDAAFDTIDKIDRNLFERYCDVQAFASFRQFLETVKSGRNMTETQELLKKVHGIYEVYHDIFLLDLKGNVVSAAVRGDLVGTSQNDRDWFRESVRGSIVVTDVYFSKSVMNHTVSFSAPIVDQSGQIYGVLSTRFNCNFINGIMSAAIVGSSSQVLLVNKKGLLVGSASGEGVLEKSFAHLRAFRNVDSHTCGYQVEVDPNDKKEYAIGFAKTPGYNTYKAKGWSILVRRPTGGNGESGDNVTPISK